MTFASALGIGLAALASQQTSIEVTMAAGRDSRAEDVRRIAGLNPVAQRNPLRTLLIDAGANGRQFPDSLFYHESRLRDSLRALVNDPEAGELAREFLVLIGVPSDVEMILRLARPLTQEPPENRWAYGVACTLLEPASEQEWAFLRKAASNEFDDRWVDYGAIQTLKLIASSRSRQILEEARRQNPHRERSISIALAYIQSNPPPLTNQHLEDLAIQVAQAVKIGDWRGNGKPHYNHAGDKALVDFYFSTTSDHFVYTATFHRVQGLWKLRGVRETLQALAPPAVPPPAQPPLILAPPPVPPSDPVTLLLLPSWLLLPPKTSPPPAAK